MAVILTIGASGQLGSEIIYLARENRNHTYIFSERHYDGLDISNTAQTKKIINKINPDWIINCAAYTQVDKAENESDSAISINAIGVNNIVNAINQSKCKLIHISTDAVYNGNLNIPHKETTPLKPISVYAKSKLKGEVYALSHPNTLIIRTSWLYSTFGGNFVKTIIKKGSENTQIDVVFDQIGTPTYARDLADMIMKIIFSTENGSVDFKSGIYNYSNEGVCSWYDFAVEILMAAKISCYANPVRSSAYISKAPRYPYSVMDKDKIKKQFNVTIPHWRDGLARYFINLRN